MIIDSLVFNLKARIVKGFLQEGRTLDVGCGDKRYTDIMPDAIGIDSSIEFEGCINRPDIVMDATDLKFPRDTFKNICYLDTMEHITNLEMAVVEASRVSTPDGIVIIVDPNDRMLKLFRYLFLRFSDAKQGNPSHIHHFNKESLVELMSPLFVLEKAVNRVIFTGYKFRNSRATRRL